MLVGKPEGKIPQGRPRRIKMNLREIGRSYVDWIHLAQNKDQRRALVNSIMNLSVPQNAGKFLSS
jgi:hypothetical protein